MSESFLNSQIKISFAALSRERMYLECKALQLRTRHFLTLSVLVFFHTKDLTQTCHLHWPPENNCTNDQSPPPQSTKLTFAGCTRRSRQRLSSSYLEIVFFCRENVDALPGDVFVQNRRKRFKEINCSGQFVFSSKDASRKKNLVGHNVWKLFRCLTPPFWIVRSKTFA